MASNARVPKAEIKGIYGYVVKTMTRRMFGQSPGVGRRDVAPPEGVQGHDGFRPQGRVVGSARPEPGVVRGHGRGRR